MKEQIIRWNDFGFYSICGTNTRRKAVEKEIREYQKKHPIKNIIACILSDFIYL